MAWLGFAACCQTWAGLALFYLMLTDKEITIRLNSRYSLGDQGFYFHFLLQFCTFLAFFLSFSCGLNIYRQIPKAWAIYKQGNRKTTISPVFPNYQLHSSTLISDTSARKAWEKPPHSALADQTDIANP